MSAQPAFNLRALVLEIIEEQGAAGPEGRALAAKKVAQRIPREHQASAFLIALTEYVRAVDASRRPQLRPVPPLPTTADEATDNANSANSGTAQAMRRLGKLLRTTYQSVGPKELGDYDADDCRMAAGRLHKIAEESSAKAAAYEKVASRLDESGTDYVRDLPAEFLLRVFYGGKV